MSESTKSDKIRRRPSVDRGMKKIRDQSIIAGAMSGKSTVEIAKELNVSRQTVSGVLNSDDAKKRIAEIDERLAVGIDAAIRTVLDAVNVDYIAARDLLRNYGSMKSNLNVQHSVDKTLEDIITAADGDLGEVKK